MPLRMEVGLGSDDSVVPALPTERGTEAPHRDRLFFRADIRFYSCTSQIPGHPSGDRVFG